jgi:formate dehydrogenase accessory protein FdhD
MSEQQYPTTKLPVDSRQVKAGRAMELTHPAPTRGPVLPRLDVQKLSRYLPKRHGIRIEINGVLAGAPVAVPDAVTEFAIGWAFMNRFFSEPDQLGRTSATASHVSLMIDGGADLERLKYEAIGWIPRADKAMAQNDDVSERRARSVAVMSELDAIASCRLAFERFDRDGAKAGYLHAGMVTDCEVACIARDLDTSAAVAKVLGWSLSSECERMESMLVVRGVVDEEIVEAAGRAEIPIVATDAVPTLAAIAAGERCCVSILGLAQSHRRGLFVDGGHLQEGRGLVEEISAELAGLEIP